MRQPERRARLRAARVSWRVCARRWVRAGAGPGAVSVTVLDVWLMHHHSGDQMICGMMDAGM